MVEFILTRLDDVLLLDFLRNLLALKGIINTLGSLSQFIIVLLTLKSLLKHEL